MKRVLVWAWVLSLSLTAWASNMVPNLININDTLVVRDLKVGIGVTTPTHSLEVMGTMYVQSSAASAGNIGYPLIVNTGSVIDWSKSPFQQIDVDGTNKTLTFVNPKGPCGLVLVIRRRPGGGGGLTFPNLKWTNQTVPSFNYSQSLARSRSVDVYDIVGLVFDGSTYLAEGNLDFR